MSTPGAFTLHSPTALTISLVGGVFATTAAATSVFPILAIVFVLIFLPETKNLELEATASAPAAH